MRDSGLQLGNEQRQGGETGVVRGAERAPAQTAVSAW